MNFIPPQTPRPPTLLSHNSKDNRKRKQRQSKKKTTMKEHERQAVQWQFTLPSFSDADIERLSTLPLEDITYVAFAIRDDDTGNHYLQGFVKTSRRRRLAYMVRLIGYGMWSTCSTSATVTRILTEIQTSPGFKEFGEVGTALTQGFRQDLASFKVAVEAGLTKDQLLVLYPGVCARFPGFVNSHLQIKQATA
jgi:hypothetical protein